MTAGSPRCSTFSSAPRKRSMRRFTTSASARARPRRHPGLAAPWTSVFIPRLVSICAAPGCGPMSGPRTPEEQTHEGAQLYQRYCALCHGAEGEGYAADHATRLRGEGFLRTVPDEMLQMAIE